MTWQEESYTYWQTDMAPVSEALAEQIRDYITQHMRVWHAGLDILTIWWLCEHPDYLFWATRLIPLRRVHSVNTGTLSGT